MSKLASSVAGAVCGALLCAAGAAAAAPLSDAQLRYRQERTACMDGSTNQDRATCLREATAALREAGRAELSGGNLEANRVQRCAALPAQDRDDCVLRMGAQGSSTGTAAQGGMLRELAQPAPARSN
jgi:hypothetical protein